MNTLSLNPVTAPKLNIDGVSHAFFTRNGGVSKGIYEGLNVGLGSSDERANVDENRARAAAYFGVQSSHLVNPWQTHSSDVVIVDKPFEGERPKADGIVTNTPNLTIGIVTADCGPILFADNHARVIGAAHAGWKGAVGGILENTIAAMEGLGAKRESIVAVLGPSISQTNYEVGPEFMDFFLGVAPENLRWFTPSKKPDHSMFDLWGYSLERLARAGVEVDCVRRCTYAEEENFYSYRRTTHRKEPDYGRQLSAIQLRES